jgi:hypothetical protein
MDLFESVYFLVCDDVREETGGKSSFMGVYAENITVPRMPALIRQICLVTIINKIQGPITHVEALVTPPGVDATRFKIPPPTPQKSMNNLTIVVAVSPFRIKEEGEILWELIFNKDDQKRLQYSKQIVLAQSLKKPIKKEC